MVRRVLLGAAGSGATRRMIWLELIEDGAWEDDWDYECLFCGGERRP